jgi:lysophospholipase L1-like esterase
MIIAPHQAPYHAGQNLAGQHLEFLPTDSRDSLERLCAVEEYRAYFQQQGWLEPGAISYRINSAGFRCEEFDPLAPNLLALGCSYTIGLGLPLQDLWPSLVGQALQLRVCNLGWGGVSADTCYRLAEYWIPCIRPRLVVMLTPPVDRFELHMATGSIPVENFMPQSEAESAPYVQQYLRHYYGNEANSQINRRKNQAALRSLCDQHGVPCQIYNCDEWMNLTREQIGYARDRMHAGPPGHQRLADQIIRDHGQI